MDDILEHGSLGIRFAHSVRWENHSDNPWKCSNCEGYGWNVGDEEIIESGETRESTVVCHICRGVGHLTDKKTITLMRFAGYRADGG